MFFLGFWFLYPLNEANFGLLNAAAHGGGTAFFAHVGGFVFGGVVGPAAGPRPVAPDEPGVPLGGQA